MGLDARTVAAERQAAGRVPAGDGYRTIRWLTFLMFFMFAMTTDSVGVIIPKVIAEFQLSQTAAGALHYGSMTAIALAGLLMVALSSRLGRKGAILLGLILFSCVAFLYPMAGSFAAILGLTVVAGAAIGIFKTGAVALVGEISPSAGELTATMNLAEGFFGLGAIVGPFLVAQLAIEGVSWRWLYVIAGALCVLLLAIASRVRYPAESAPVPADAARGPAPAGVLLDPYALGFGIAAFAYVAVECAIYVWMPTLLQDVRGAGAGFAPYALPAFFALRAAGRFLGAWLLRRFEWSLAILICGAGILAAFACSLVGGVEVAVFLLPATGLLMSILYPTINSKGIGCFDCARQGRVAGLILFFTCAGAALGPLAMGVVSDTFGGARYGFVLATFFAGLLFAGLTANWLLRPAHARLAAFGNSTSTGSA